jgi:chemotaxis protein MotB
MARRRKEKLTEENHERWLVSYADFITLLFAFFVVMYAISSVNEGKFRVLSETLNDAFGKQRSQVGSVLPVQPGDPIRDLVALPDPLPLHQGSGDKDPLREKMTEQALRAMQQAASQQRVYDELAISLRNFIDNDLIDLQMNGNQIEVSMTARMLFSSGDARLSPQASDALRQVAQSLVRIRNPIQVEGHTDNVPISNFLYRSNWELSAARAASVVHFLQEQGVEPDRLAAVGMGEFRPIADNDTEQGRARNRRVTLKILGAEPELFKPDQIVPWAEAPAVSR